MKKSTKNNFELIKIKSIEITDEACEMYDLEVPEIHNFILANGIVTHNSANLEINAIRQADFLILKPSSLLQKDFERKTIKEIYEEAEAHFQEFKEYQGLAYIYSDRYKGFITNPLPTFWSQKTSKAFSGKK